ncbi:MAG: signal peptide peptidase SppA [bacterium]|nr:signal peptide peptidase SppA [bacterium]
MTDKRTSPAPARIAGRALANLGGFLRDAAVAPFASFVPRDWLVIRLDRGVTEVPSNRPGFFESFMPAPPPLSSTLEALEMAREDPRLRGVIVRVGSASLGWAKVASLARSFSLLRESGKKLVAYSESTGNAGAWLGGLADRFWMAPEARLDLIGVRAQSLFFRRALDRWHIRPEVIAAGRYKSAADIIDRDSMSEPAREALEAVVEHLYRSLVCGLVAGRAQDEEQAVRWIDEGPYLAAEAAEAGLIDELLYPDELPVRLAQLERDELESVDDAEEQPEARLIGTSSYLKLARPRFVWHSLSRGRAQVAVVPLTGTIRRASSSPKGVVGLLHRLERDDRVRAVVLRVDSPGGDSLASDMIWRAVRTLSEAKPVVASMGDTAASGGYYAAMAAREIVAESTTLTGSIGVVLISLGIDEFLNELGASSEGVQRGAHADIYDATGRRSRENKAVLKRQVQSIYESFVKKAAESRGVSERDLRIVAEGRVWTGAQAHEKKLVDALGGVDLALERARALAGLGSDEGEAVYYPAASSLAQLLRSNPLETHLLSPGAQCLCPTEVPLD